ncbi:hypothetical protein [Pyrobaculum calidifontis]|uniref:Uncharacterized protein n=1 Tax=Pyrobaculum calidifontis (strain DSM 21063 / JCM 11548 / VA1) TaxID=410359 RepID=A3MT17_PYRCJ|nr:hypothetical protein [Pyrobaculum calidifontis]ABO07784.1 hypothetical protein Pcal_0349 [Pyrobaculum calidifontis JCM 11548]
MRWIIPALVIAAAALAANVTYVVTPSGNIHITYQDNGTFIVINFNNNKTLTINAKLNITNATDLYYIHVVGKAVGVYNSTAVKALLSTLQNATRAQALETLRQLAYTLAASNSTRELKVKAFITARSLNATYNATWLRMKVEYEFEKKLGKLNGTRVTTENELEIKGYAANAQKLAEVLRALARQLAPVDNATASALLQISNRINGTAISLKTVQNGTEIKVVYKNGKFEIEIERGRDKKHEERDAAGGKQEEKKEENGKEESKQGNKSNDDDSKEKKDSGESKKDDKKSDEGGGEKEKSEKKKR